MMEIRSFSELLTFAAIMFVALLVSGFGKAVR